MLDGATRRIEHGLRNAYLTAALVRVAVNDPKNFPSYEKLIARKGGSRVKRMSPKEILAAARVYTKSVGGKVS